MKIVYQSMIGALLWLLPMNLQALCYNIQDLGTLPADESQATRINNQNSILGSLKQAGNTQNFIWKPSQGLVYLLHSSYKLPLINNHNQVVSFFWHTTNYWFAENVRSKHFYIYHNDGTFQDLGSPTQWKTQELDRWKTPSVWDKKGLEVLAFNDDQQVLISNSNEVDNTRQLAIWGNGTFKEIDPSIISIAYRMNNQGMILARKWVQKENVNVPMLVLYNSADGTISEIMKDIDIANRQLNDLGQVIIVQEKPAPKGFLWDPMTGLIDLGDFAPAAFNNSNQIIGVQISKFQDKKIVPLMWTPSEVIPLTQFIGSDNPESIWSEVTSLTGINDNGYIIGQGLFDGKKHAFVLIPQ